MILKVYDSVLFYEQGTTINIIRVQLPCTKFRAFCVVRTQDCLLPILRTLVNTQYW
jgi:hypothetical protein